ncbi:MAG: putative lipid II flippase FtsW [Clostridia bacterium]|nr:putative lipid II flippase FtsW [Clostridia bacterium]
MAKKKKKVKKNTQGVIDYPFLVISLLILSIGLLMVFSASYPSAYYSPDDISSTHYFFKQGAFAIIGLGLAYIVVKMGYKRIAKLAPILIVVSALLLLAVIAFGTRVNGAKRWIYIGFNFQPSEVAKTALILFFAFLITKYSDRMKTFKFGILPFVITLGVICGLLAAQPHFSGIIIIGIIGVCMMFLGGSSVKWLAGAGVAGAGLVAIGIMAFPYARQRVATLFNDPFKDIQGAGYQIVQSLYAIGSGGLFGLGFGNSRQKHLYLPEPHNDFIFAVACEELGFVGALIIIILFAIFIWRGYLIAMRAPDKLGCMIAAGVTTHFAVQIALNLLVVTGVFPVTGVSLPLFSYGGTALVMQLVEIGLVLSVSKGIIAPKAG